MKFNGTHWDSLGFIGDTLGFFGAHIRFEISRTDDLVTIRVAGDR